MFWLVTLGDTKTNQIDKTFPRWTFRYNNHAFVKSKQVKANNLVNIWAEWICLRAQLQVKQGHIDRR
jgi:hypothetical protein